MSLAAVLPRKVQELLPQQQSRSTARSCQVCLVTCRSVAAGRVMRGLSPSSLCKRRCSLSYPSHIHPNEGKARVTRRRWRWEMMRFRAKVGGGMMPSLKMTLSAVKVMRYVSTQGGRLTLSLYISTVNCILQYFSLEKMIICLKYANVCYITHGWTSIRFQKYDLSILKVTSSFSGLFF